MPLFSHRFTTASSSSPASPSYYNKPSSKTHKPNSSSSSSYALSRIHVAIIFFSLVSVFIGVAGTIFALSSTGPASVYRCGGSKDTSRVVSTSRKLGGDGGNSVVERRKLLGFVGIQTGFDSGDRRTALRSTWFPSDPDSLLRYLNSLILFIRMIHCFQILLSNLNYWLVRFIDL